MKAGRAAKGRLAAFFLSVWMLAACTGTARAASGFTDVNAGAYYAAAVDWAVSKGITTGTSTTAFSPDRTCTQAEIVTFLYRARDVWANTSGETNGQEDTTMPKLNITVNGQSFTATLDDTQTARAFLEQLPMTVSMGELNGNEKFYYLPSGLPTNASRPGNIHAGDLMLYGSDCLVLFYESFFSSYSYTRLGSVDDPSGLAAVLGQGRVEVTFQAG